MELSIITEKYPWHLLLLADPDRDAVNRYLQESDCYVVWDNQEIIAVAVIQATGYNIFELKNIAIAPAQQQKGYGSKLLTALLRLLKNKGGEQLEVGTGTFGYQLKFYQKLGFRVTDIRKDFFLDHYTEPIIEDGLQHKDMLVLTYSFASL